MSKILGINKRCYPSVHGGYVEITVVLVVGSIGDYAAYSGNGDPEWVARFGDKLPYKEAACHFPSGLKESKYRL